MRMTAAAAAMGCLLTAAPALGGESWPQRGHDAARTNRSAAVSAPAPLVLPGWPVLSSYPSPPRVAPNGAVIVQPAAVGREAVVNRDGTVARLGGVSGVRAIGPDGRRYTVDAAADRVSAWSPSGALIWRGPSVDVGPEASDRQIVPAPDGTVYESGLESTVAYDPLGNVRWESRGGFEGAAGALAVAADGTVVFAQQAASQEQVLSARRPDGTVVWQRTVPARVDAVAIAGDAAVAVHNRTGPGGGAAVRAYALSDGAERWSVPTGTAVADAPAVEADGGVVVATPGLLRRIGPDGGVRWTLAGRFAGAPVIGGDGTVYQGGEPLTAVLPDGRVRWRLPVRVRATPEAIGADGTLYVWLRYTGFLALAGPGARGTRIPPPQARPLIAGLRLGAAVFRTAGSVSVCPRGRASCRPAIPLGSTITFRLSRDAAVALVVRRRDTRAVVARLDLRGTAGTNWRAALDLRVVRRGVPAASWPLPPGRYTLEARAAAGTVRRTTGAVGFTVAAPARAPLVAG